jgi:hypothetical protein
MLADSTRKYEFSTTNDYFHAQRTHHPFEFQVPIQADYLRQEHCSAVFLSRMAVDSCRTVSSREDRIIAKMPRYWGVGWDRWWSEDCWSEVEAWWIWIVDGKCSEENQCTRTRYSRHRWRCRTVGSIYRPRKHPSLVIINLFADCACECGCFCS